MLSRLALFRSVQDSGVLLPIVGVRFTQTSATNKNPATTAEVAENSAVRDLVNFPRPKRREYSVPVRLGFISEEWCQSFYKKTGYLGPYTFLFTFSTYLISKEIYVMEHEFYSGLSLLLMIIVFTKKFGPAIGSYLDKEVDEVERSWERSRETTKDGLAKSINAEKEEQWRAEGSKLLMQAKKENVKLQLEAIYRERAIQVYNEVKKRLDYQAERQAIDRRINHKHMVNWIVSNVLKSITPQQEKESLQKCIADLKNLAKA